MGREHHIRQIVESGVGGRLLLADVQAGARQPPSYECSVQGNLVTLGSDDANWVLREGSSTSNLYVEGWNTSSDTTWNNRGNNPPNNTVVVNAGGAPAIGAPLGGSPYFGVCRTPSNTTARLSLEPSAPVWASEAAAPAPIVTLAAVRSLIEQITQTVPDSLERRG